MHRENQSRKALLKNDEGNEWQVLATSVIKPLTKMARYYVNRNAQANGDHEVHKDGCIYMPQSKHDLGEHSNCHTAVRLATAYYSKVNGCRTCSSECHTS